jgi:glycosyltransferase involved in cell wall biosynthesis
MKIAVVTSYFPKSTRVYDGNSAVQTLRHLQKCAEIEVFCPIATYPRIRGLAPPNYRPEDPDFRPPHFKTTYVNYPAVAGLSRGINGRVLASRVLPLLRASKPNLILNYWLYPDGYAAVAAARKLGVPSIVCAIGSDLRARNEALTKRLVHKTMLQADAVITVSDELRNVALAEQIPPEKVTTILNGCDHSIFYPGDRAEARRELAITGNSPLILFVGSLLAAKGLGELMEASRGLQLAIVGQGPFEAQLKGRDDVLLAGRQDANGVARWMRACDVFCLPSYSEGCPNVVVEALSCGRPVVATNVGGIPELVNESNGILIPPRDAGKLRAALETALARSWPNDSMFTRTWEDVANETFAICERLYAEP